MGYCKHKEKTGMEVRPKLKSLSRKNKELRMLRLSVLIESVKKKEMTLHRKDQL